MEEYICVIERPVSADSAEEAAEKFLHRLEDGDLGIIEVFDESPVDTMDTDRRVKAFDVQDGNMRILGVSVAMDFLEDQASEDN